MLTSPGVATDVTRTGRSAPSMHSCSVAVAMSPLSRVTRPSPASVSWRPSARPPVQLTTASDTAASSSTKTAGLGGGTSGASGSSARTEDSKLHSSPSARSLRQRYDACWSQPSARNPPPPILDTKTS